MAVQRAVGDYVAHFLSLGLRLGLCLAVSALVETDGREKV